MQHCRYREGRGDRGVVYAMLRGAGGVDVWYGVEERESIVRLGFDFHREGLSGECCFSCG